MSLSNKVKDLLLSSLGSPEARNELVNAIENPPSGSGDIKSDGSVPFAANLNMDTHKIINVTDPTTNQDAATKKYVDNSSTWTKYTVTFQDILNGTVIDPQTSDAILGSVPAKQMVERVIINVTTPFNGGTIGSASSLILLDGNILNSVDGFVNTTFPITAGENLLLTSLSSSGDLIFELGVDTAINDLTQGSADVYIKTSNLP